MIRNFTELVTGSGAQGLNCEMRVLGRKRLADFARKHASARKRIAAWLLEAEEAAWKSPRDVLDQYPRASVITGERVVFDLGSDRLDVRIDYRFGLVVIMRIGTHDDYDRWDF
jgi:mRNA interferase HigB